LKLNIRKKLKFVLIFGLLSFSIYNTFQIFHIKIHENYYSIFTDFKGLENAGYWDLTGSPIFIDDADPNYNWSKTVNDNDWCYGTGTWNEPYIIENITLDAQNLDNCIEIRNSQSSYFIIRNCNFSGSSTEYRDAAIKFYNSRNGAIKTNNCSRNKNGIILERSNNNTIYNNEILFNQGLAIEIYGGINNKIIGNSIKNNTGNGIVLNGASATCEFNYVSNNEIEFNHGGINLINQCERNKIHNNTITKGENGFDNSNADYNNFTYNTIKRVNNLVLFIQYCEYNYFINNSFQDCRSGATLSWENHNNHFINNSFKNTTGIVFLPLRFTTDRNFHNLFHGNKFYNCGMILDLTPEEAVTTTVDTSNLVNGKPIYYYVNMENLNSNNFLNPGQIFLNNCSNSIISDLKITKTWAGINIHNSRKIEINNNFLTNNIYGGIKIDYSNETYIHNNHLLNNLEAGITVYGSFQTMIYENLVEASYGGIVLFGVNEPNSIMNNQIYNNTYGIYMYYSGNNSIYNNRLKYNKESAIFAIGSINNTVYKNSIIDNRLNGINLDSSSVNNMFFMNYFIDNSHHAIDNGTNNLWDNGSIGNYWDDYIGIDADYDNIGDTPYNISGLDSSIDNLPIYSLPSPIISIRSPLEYSLYGNIPPDLDLIIESVDTDIIWYYLDDGIVTTNNYTFTDSINQGVWDLLGNGTIRIRVYVNDTLGKVNFNEVFLSKDIIAPQITINSPISLTNFEENSPSFDLSILEGNLDNIWYSHDGGITNYQCGTSGQINQILWDSLPDGDITIRFYANDTLGNTDFAEVTITKSIPQTQNSPTISGYNPLFFLGLITITMIILIKKLRKN